MDHAAIPSEMPNPESRAVQRQPVICVGLDGVVASDLFWESLLLLFKTQPLKLFFFPVWLWRGKAYFKRQIAFHVSLNPATLPYREDVLKFLRMEKSKGRKILLATGLDQTLAEAVSRHLGLFGHVLATDGTTHPIDRHKVIALENSGGEDGFDCLGNRKVDFSLRKDSSEAMLVQPSARLLRRIQNGGIVCRIFSPRRNVLPSLMHGLRIHQWVKNLLLFVPLVLAHRIFEGERLSLLLDAFFSFSLCASSVYIVNDLLDLEADRHHPKKKFRPFAAGTLPISMGFIFVPFLIVLSFLIAILMLPPLFGASLVVYLVLTTAYSFYLKRVVLVDVVILAGLYTIRVLSGAVAVDAHVSAWLLAFCIFLFFSLALLKRYSEFSAMRESDESFVNGRGYHFADKGFLLIIGIASGYLSLLIFILYVNSEEVILLYHNPQYLWLICPLFLYWITRMWLFAYRGPIVDDPLVFMLKDPASYAVGAAIGLATLLAL